MNKNKLELIREILAQTDEPTPAPIINVEQKEEIQLKQIDTINEKLINEVKLLRSQNENLNQNLQKIKQIEALTQETVKRNNEALTPDLTVNTEPTTQRQQSINNIINRYEALEKNPPKDKTPFNDIEKILENFPIKQI